MARLGKFFCVSVLVVVISIATTIVAHAGDGIPIPIAFSTPILEVDVEDTTEPEISNIMNKIHY